MIKLAIGVLCLIFSYIEYNSYKKWRKSKSVLYGHNKLEPWDYTLNIKYWTVIISAILSGVILLFQFLIE